MLLRSSLTVIVMILMVGGIVTGVSAQVEPVGIVSGNPHEVYRRYVAPETSVAPVFGGEPISLYSFGIVEASETAARRSMELVPEFVADLGETVFGDLESESGVDIESNRPVVANIDQMGDESVAYTIKARYGTIDVEFGMVLVRDGAWIQWIAASAYGSNGATLRVVEDVALNSKGRWPSDSRITVRDDGLRTGGVWNMAALPEDVPDYLEVDPNYDEGPGPDPVPTLTPVPLPTATHEAPEASGSTDLSHGSRLAQPFDVTFRAILTGEDFVRDGQGRCSGVGTYAGLSEGGAARLTTVDGSEELASIQPLEAGFITYDLELNAEVCAVELRFTDVPPRANFQLVGGDIQLGEFTFEEIAAQGVVEFVVASSNEP